MAHVLCITSGLTGILHASFEVVRRIEARGHRVTYLSSSPVAETVEAQGIRFMALPPFVSDPVPHRPPRGGPIGRLGALVTRVATRPVRVRQGTEALRLDAYEQTLQSLAPDLIVADIEAHESILAAHRLGVRLLLLSQWFSTWSGTGMPPLGSDVVPGRGPAGDPEAVRELWDQAERRTEAKRRRRLLRGHVDRGDVLRAYAQKSGVPPGELTLTAFPPPLAYRSLPVLSMTLAELEFPQTPRPNLHYVGPMVDAERHDLRVGAEVGGRVESVVQWSRETGAKLISCTVSSMDAGDTTFVRKLIRAVARRPDWLLVVGLGGNVEPEALGALPPNAFAFGWTPQLRLLEAADVSVNHAGIHTINECIHFGVPMLVYSGGRYDQNGCAARVDYHGIGLRGDKDLDDESEIGRKLARVLEEPGFRQNMARVRAHYVRHREENSVGTLVDAHLQAPPS